MSNDLNIFRYFKDPTTITMFAYEDILAHSVVYAEGNSAYMEKVPDDPDIDSDYEENFPYFDPVIGISRNSALQYDKVHIAVCGVFKVRIKGYFGLGDLLKPSLLGGTVEVTEDISEAIAVVVSFVDVHDINKVFEIDGPDTIIVSDACFLKNGALTNRPRR